MIKIGSFSYIFIVLLSCFVSLSQPVFSIDRHDFKVEYLNVSTGMSTNMTTKIISDQKGIKWFASSEGLHRFDGESYTNLKPSARYKGLKSENIETIYLDRAGDIWVGTKSGGLSKYDIKHDTFTNYNHLLKPVNKVSPLRVMSILEDKKGRLWVGTWEHGVYVIDPNKNKTVHFFEVSHPIQGIIEDNQQDIWFGGETKLYRFSDKEEKVVKIESASTKRIRWIMELYYDKRRGELYLGGTNGVFRFDFKTQNCKPLVSPKEGKLYLINAISIDRQGRIWAGSWRKGLYVSNPERTNFQKVDLLPESQVNKNFENITDINIEANGLIWVATSHAGIVKLTPQKGFHKIANSPKRYIGLPDNNILTLTKDSNGALWCGSVGGGIGYSKDRKQFEKLPFSEGGYFHALMELDRKMYICMNKGIFMLEIDRPFDVPQPVILSPFINKVRVMHLDKQNNLWLGTQQNGVLCINISKGWNSNLIQIFSPNQKGNNHLGSDRIESIIEDKSGTIWVSSYNGLYRYDKTEGRFVNQKISEQFHFPTNIILSAVASPKEDKLWIGGSGGILELETGNDSLALSKHYQKADGLESDYITALTLDMSGNIWAGHNKGLSMIKNDEQTVYNFGLENGVDISSVNIGAVDNQKDLIYFGGKRGIMVFAPDFVKVADTRPSVIFSNLKIDNVNIKVGDKAHGNIILEQDISYTKNIELSYQDKVTVFSFVVDDYLDYKNVQFYYRILGLSDQWLSNGNSNEVGVTQLSGGDYVLEVKATRDGKNFGEVSALSIHVTTAPWLSWWAVTLYILIGLVMAFVVFRFMLKQTKLEGEVKLAALEKEKEHELAEAKLRFFTNISHELRTPLTLIHSPLSELMQEESLSENVRKKMHFMHSNSLKLLHLINQLLDFRKAENDKLTLNLSENNLIDLLEGIFMSFQSHAESRQIRFTLKFEVSRKSNYTFDKDKMEIVLNNLLSNAFKFTEKGGQVELGMREEEQIVIYVKDSGRGIKRKYLKNIFNRYFQANDPEASHITGSGIGLSLTKNIVELHGGSIEVVSEERQGSQFSVYLPLQTPNNMVTEKFVAEKEVFVAEQQEEEMVKKLSEAKNKILIVDDNDDIRNYLKSIFEGSYNVYTAADGKAGLHTAIEQVPDIIISDVMMPEMDGLELCEQLRQHQLVSHIPIILLTARTSAAFEIEGLESGADDYIKKPFDSQVIKHKVEAILRSRKALHKYFQQQLQVTTAEEIKLSPPEKPTNYIDEKLINKAIDYIEQHIDNEELNVEMLSHELCMSQSTLYRKIKANTNMSIVGFIRSVRLKKAAEMLIEEEDVSLSVVGALVGIHDYRYFKKVFIKQYNLSPAEYRERYVQREDT